MNADIRIELDIFSLNESVDDYRNEWKNYTKRMFRNRIPRLLKKYIPEEEKAQDDLRSDGNISEKESKRHSQILGRRRLQILLKTQKLSF